MKKILLNIAILLIATISAVAQTTIKGRVKAAIDNSAVPGVSVLVKGTTLGTTTNGDGDYAVSIPDKDAVIIFSFIGMKSVEVAVGSQTTIDVSMEEDLSTLGEVVVTALGLKKEEKTIGYAVSKITANDVTNAGTTNFATALYGKAAGVRINAANGGAASAVNIQIRGVTSYSGNTQPLYVVDGIPIRNSSLLSSTKAPANNGSFFDEPRVRENGILDINPEDIESLNILKGASATALYGSDGANGVVVITTKKGTKKNGLGVDVKLQYDGERLAYQPSWQNSYGPGYDGPDNLAITGNKEGWITDADGSVHPYYRAYAHFGPKFDGRTVKYWDGTQRAYKASPNNYKKFFENGFNKNASFAISGASDKGSFRVSYTRTDYKGIMPGFNLEKNYFALNSTVKLSEKVSVDIISSYVNSLTHNRPYMLNQIFGSYDGFYSRMDDMDTYRNKYQTSQGYKYVQYNQPYNDTEKLAYKIRGYNLLDYYWTQLKNSHNEYQNRFLNSATLNVKVSEKLTVRGRIGNDFTNTKIEDKQHAQYPSAFGNSGSYSIATGTYGLLYGDALVSYTDKITSDISMTLSAGAIGRKDNYTDIQSQTNGGLVVENWFNLYNSANPFTTNDVKSAKQNSAFMAGFGIAEFSYKNLLFIQGTAREESRSTLPPGHNKYFYPSVNSSFVFSDAIKLPSVVDYGRLRASWGVVANTPSIYAASVAYGLNSVSTSNGTAIYESPSTSYGNNGIKPEMKHETEFGLETSFFQNKFGLDVSYYHNIIKDQILPVSTAASTGATSYLANIGNITNAGFDLALRATPIKTSDFRWDIRFNYGVNKNKLNKLMAGVSSLTSYNMDNGSLYIRADEGETMGNIYVHPILKSSSGQNVVNDLGLYSLDLNKYEKVGNVMPKGVGGLVNTISYKNFTLNIVTDYKFGGSLISAPYLYMSGAGAFKSTMKYRDAAHGGLAYNMDGSGNMTQSSSGTYHDGLILNGVTSDGSKNTKLIDAGTYYMNEYGWGAFGSGYENLYQHAVHKNDFIKMREVSLSYFLPKTIVEKVGFKTLQVSLVGRNLFYLYRTLPDHWDPESPTGSSWLYQGIDQASAGPTRSLGVMLRASF
jgi:iron complex outermembrane receptor protein